MHFSQYPLRMFYKYQISFFDNFIANRMEQCGFRSYGPSESSDVIFHMEKGKENTETNNPVYKAAFILVSPVLKS